MDYERDYIRLVDRAVNGGSPRFTRAGRARASFGEIIRIRELEYGFFPALTTRYMYLGPVFGELAAFLKEATMLRDFHALGCHYWDGNAAAWPANHVKAWDEMRVGKVYGAKWRDFGGEDQLRNLVSGLVMNPEGRRHVMTTWDPAERDQCLPPCHILSQFFVDENRLSLAVYMRSVDLCLGLPSDVVLYAGLLVLVAKEVELGPGSI